MQAWHPQSLASAEQEPSVNIWIDEFKEFSHLEPFGERFSVFNTQKEAILESRLQAQKGGDVYRAGQKGENS